MLLQAGRHACHWTPCVLAAALASALPAHGSPPGPLARTRSGPVAGRPAAVVAGAGWPDLLDILPRHGRYAVAGAVAGPLVELDVRTLYLKDLSFFGCTALDAGVFANLVTLIETGTIKPLIAEIFPLKDIAKAQQTFAEKNYIGKIVLDIQPSS